MIQSGARSHRGHTVMELMVVVAIVSILLGSSTAFFASMRRGYRLQTSAGEIVSLLRNARQWAIAGSARSRVDIDRKQGWVRSVGRQVVGQWHFEDDTTRGARGRDGVVTGAILVPGRFGQGFLFGQVDGSHINCGPLATYGFSSGIAMEAWIEPQRRMQQIIVRAGRSAVFWIDEEMRLVGEAGGAQVETAPGALSGNRFTHVAMVADGHTLSLWIDRIEVAKVDMTASIRFDPDEKLLISDPRHSFQGRIDEVRIDSLVTLDTLQLPERIRILLGPDQIAFDSRGRLDPTAHGEQERLLLFSESRVRWYLVEVSRPGTFRVQAIETEAEAVAAGMPLTSGNGSGVR